MKEETCPKVALPTMYSTLPKVPFKARDRLFIIPMTGPMVTPLLSALKYASEAALFTSPNSLETFSSYP